MTLRVLLLMGVWVGMGCTKTPGAEGAGGGGGGEPGCPKDLLAAKGKSCSAEGKTCGTSTPGFSHFLMCSGGKWVEMEAAPPPPPPPPPG